MKSYATSMLIAAALAGVAGCAEYALENRVPVAYSGRGGDRVHMTPYPMSIRAAEIWQTDACWRGCSVSCSGQFNVCAKTGEADICRNDLDRCDRLCVFKCRISGGPLLYGFE